MAITNDSLRLSVLKGLKMHLVATIAIENDYKHDITEKMVRTGSAFMPSDKDPDGFLNIFEHIPAPGEMIKDAEPVGGTDDPAIAYWLKLDVSGFGKVGSVFSPADDTYELMADVKKACGLLDLYVENRQLFNGVRIADVMHDPGSVLPQTMVDQKTLRPQFVVQVSLKVVESAADPYRLTDD